ncbi:hypothetical protein [Bacteroides sp. 224]|uniref:hypothetical protein n=1 Tax=Bacteroides sp. 224 TaxID=2302936 RepID=UPI0013D6A329|nr:hypothetical protein [Bacteroides sp. 224]NDV63923.1 hypothetical protein [Bacteroides sp. 224]
MSIARRNRRAQARESQKHFNVLAELLMGFYEFLEQEEKPSNEQVRTEFKIREKHWKGYCKAHQLTEEASLLFNKEVGQSWKNRYAEQQSPIQN